MATLQDGRADEAAVLFRAIRMDPGLEAQPLNLMRSQLKMFIVNGILVKESRTILETILN